MTETPIESADAEIPIILGTLHDGRVLMEFRGIAVDHFTFSQERALELAEGLAETAKEAGCILLGGWGDPEIYLGALADGRVVMDFVQPRDYAKMTPTKALLVAKGLVDMARAARAGREVLTGARVHRV